MTVRRNLATVCLALTVSISASRSGLAQDFSILNKGEGGDPQLNPPAGVELLPAAQEVQAPVPSGQQAQSEDMDLLTRGPLHEAFAEVQQENPVPNVVVRKQPPEPINELPPQYKPEGQNVEWIPGYWAWDEERSDFIWISGIWRDVPPGQRWVPGYWESVSDGFRWVNGFWMEAKAETLNYLPPPPASLDNGPSTPAPSENHFYAPGNWVYQAEEFVWQPGYWMSRVEEWVYVPAAYIWTPRGCIFRPGYWDRLFDCRGLVFAPVCYYRPIYTEFNYYYTPTCVINTNFDLLPHLFVRRNCRSYYFGDWYDDRYVGNDFCAWSQINRRPQFGRCYDPFFTYYSHSAIQYNQINLISWVRQQNDVCLRDIHRRPSRTFNVQINIDNHHHHDGHALADNRPVIIADTIERRVKSNEKSSGKRVVFTQIADQERKEIQRAADPIATIARERKQIEGRPVLRSQKTTGEQGEPVVTLPAENQPKLSLPKVERTQIEAAERAAAELKRQQEREERANKVAERRQAKGASQTNGNGVVNQVPNTTANNPVLQHGTDSARAKRQTGDGNAPGKPVLNQLSDPNVSSSDGQPLDKQTVRRLENERRLQEIKNAQQQRELQRTPERQQDAQQRELQRQQRIDKSIQPRKGSQVIDPSLGADKNVRKQLDQQQLQQRQLEIQQRRATEQATQQAEAQRREAERSLQRQQEALQRASRQQQFEQDRAMRQQQDQMRDQQRQAQEQAARQQRELERQQRDSERQQQREERRKKNG